MKNRWYDAEDSGILRNVSIATEPVLAVTPAKVEAVVKRLVEMGHPQKIILFGSYARGTHREGSDLDILVITGDDVTQPHKESARLRRAVDDILMAMDIVVVPESVFHQLRNQPGLVYREACEQGQVVYESSD